MRQREIPQYAFARYFFWHDTASIGQPQHTHHMQHMAMQKTSAHAHGTSTHYTHVSQWIEHHDVVQAIQELWPEEGACCLQHLLLNSMLVCLGLLAQRDRCECDPCFSFHKVPLSFSFQWRLLVRHCIFSCEMRLCNPGCSSHHMDPNSQAGWDNVVQHSWMGKTVPKMLHYTAESICRRSQLDF